jgi:predicted GNAT family N-acyltransferase
LSTEERPKFTIEPLDVDKHNRAAFLCEEYPLTEYIRERARHEVTKKVTAVYVMTNDGKTIAGYYTLSQYAIDVGEIPEEVTKALKLPKYKMLPATLLGRLARDSRFRGRGLGELLLMSALKQALDTSRTVGSFAVVVETKNQNAENFYKSFGFISVPARNDRLFLPMRTIGGMF